MRYPQLFATLAIENIYRTAVKRRDLAYPRIGKTAPAYYNTRYLTHYYAKQGIVPKFYFIVDRLDLLKQAQREFTARDLVVHTIDSREAFVADIKSAQTLHNHAGKAEITVVNIQNSKTTPMSSPVTTTTSPFSASIFSTKYTAATTPKAHFLPTLISPT